MLKNQSMAKYTAETAKEIPDEKISQELLDAQRENIAKPNSDVSTISNEITRRLKRTVLQLIILKLEKWLGL